MKEVLGKTLAEYRPSIPIDIKRNLLSEAGNKCANPGCANGLTEFHHIRDWATYKSHDQDHMIVLCPSCHDSVTRGGVRIDDETLYRWKGIARTSEYQSAHIYVEPNMVQPKLLLGSVSVTSETKMIVFELNDKNALEFVISGETILLPRLRIGEQDNALIDVIDGHVISRDQSLEFIYRPGKVRVTDSAIRERIPDWASPIIAAGSGIELEGQPLLDLEVLAPNLLKVQGVWVDDNAVVIINDNQLAFIYPGLQRPLSLVGDGEESVLAYIGSSSAIFKLVNMMHA